MMTCFYCKGNTQESTTTHVVDLKNCIIIVKNVPCLECTQCGEKFFNDAVAEQLDKIVIAAREAVTEVAIVNYSDKVA